MSVFSMLYTNYTIVVKYLILIAVILKFNNSSPIYLLAKRLLCFQRDYLQT